MKITFTIREIKDLGKWDQLCELLCWNPWCLSEGMVSYDEEVELSVNQIAEMGLMFDQIHPPIFVDSFEEYNANINLYEDFLLDCEAE